jgi:hypothetical protein
VPVAKILTIEKVDSPEGDPADLMEASLRAHFQEGADRDQLRRAENPPKNVYASGYHPCVRRLYHDVVDGARRPPWTVDHQVRFWRGDQREMDWVALLNTVGPRSDPPFYFEGGQERIEIRDRKNRVLITGRIDGYLRFADGSRRPCEIKSWAEGLWRNIRGIDSLLENRFTRGAVFQLLAYQFGKGIPEGLFLFDGPGFPRFRKLHLEAHLQLMERFLQNAEAALDARDNGTVPEGVNRPDLCNRCWASGVVCFPEVAIAGLQIVDDEEREGHLAEWLGPACESCGEGPSLKEVTKRGGKLWKLITDEWRGVKEAACGAFLVSGKPERQTKYHIPEEVKARYREELPEGRWKTFVVPLEANGGAAPPTTSRLIYSGRRKSMIEYLLIAASCFTLLLDGGQTVRLDGVHLQRGKAGTMVFVPPGLIDHFERMSHLPGGPKIPVEKLRGMVWVEFDTLQDPRDFVEEGSTFPTPDLACGECYTGGQPPDMPPGTCWPNAGGQGCSVCRVCTDETTKKWGGVVYEGIWVVRKIKQKHT